jgi:hypothetical protein
MGNPVQEDAKLYQTRYGTVFHVEPVPFRQGSEGRIGRVQRRYEQLGRQRYYLTEQPLKVARVKLRRRVIHK